MQMFSIAVETVNSLGASLPLSMERVITLIKPIEFEPSERATLRRESGDGFSEELV